MPNYFGAIDFGGDTDTFTQTLIAGRTYYIELEADGSNLDSVLRIFRQGTFIDSDDDGGVGVNSRIVFRPSVTDTYAFEAAGFGSTTGDYVLRVNEDDFRNSVEGVGGAGGAGNARDPDAGEINYAGDRDVFATRLIAGLRYDFTQVGVDGGEGTLANPYLRLLDDFDAVLDENDNAGGGRDSSFEYQADYTGLHYLQAGAAFGTGSYVVDVGIGRGSGRSDTIIGTAAADEINGIGAGDLISGGGGGDYLFGGSGNDRLWGESGTDTLVGWLGRDVLVGGSSRDVFQFTAAADSTGSSTDRIVAGDGAAAMQGVGVTGGDLIDLEAIDANVNLSGNQDFRFDRTGIQGLSLRSDGSVTVARGNVDEDGAYEFILRIEDGTVSRLDYTARDFDL